MSYKANTKARNIESNILMNLNLPTSGTTSLLILAASLSISTQAFSEQINHLINPLEMSKSEVAEYGYQVADTWYARVKLAPPPKSMHPQSEPHMVRLIGELSESIAIADESAENLQNLNLYLNKYLPNQCAILKNVGYLNNTTECIEYVKVGADANKDLRTVAIFNMNFAWGKYKTINIEYIKK